MPPTSGAVFRQTALCPGSAELANLLTHNISNLRKEAALALGEIDSTATLPALHSAASDPDPEVCKAVSIAIAQLSLLSHEPRSTP